MGAIDAVSDTVSPGPGRASPAIRISLLNDFEVVLAGLTYMLAPFSDRVEVVQLAAQSSLTQSVDIALVDDFGRASNPFRSDDLRRAHGARRVVYYGCNDDPDVVKHCLAEGAGAYLSKRLSAADLVAALERVHAGESVVADGLLGDGVVSDWPGRHAGLTEREASVVALISQGLSNQEVAERSFLSINTVKSYIRTAYPKMEVRNRSRAVLWALDNGFRHHTQTTGHPPDEL